MRTENAGYLGAMQLRLGLANSHGVKDIGDRVDKLGMIGLDRRIDDGDDHTSPACQVMGFFEPDRLARILRHVLGQCRPFADLIVIVGLDEINVRIGAERRQQRLQRFDRPEFKAYEGTSSSTSGTGGSAVRLYWRASRAPISSARAAFTRTRTSSGRCGRPAVSAAIVGGIGSASLRVGMGGVGGGIGSA